MLSYVKNNFKLNSKQKILNKKYWDNYNFLFRKYNKFNYHLHGNYDSVYSSYFLRNNCQKFDSNLADKHNCNISNPLQNPKFLFSTCPVHINHK